MEKLMLPSSSSNSEFPQIFLKCTICLHAGHGIHFGVFTCRACAAFFRRGFLSKTLEYRKCRRKTGKCEPSNNGGWFCKKCRFDRCVKWGMSAENIQFHRDVSKAKIPRKLSLAKRARNEVNIFKTVEEASHLVTFIRQVGKNRNLPHVDTSLLVQKAITTIFHPNLVKTPGKLNTLEQLTNGLQEIRSEQKWILEETHYLTQDNFREEIERNMCATAKWLSCSDMIKGYDDELKVVLLRSIWWVWGRLEQISTTARMRIQEKCGKKQVVFSPDSVLDYDSMVADISCWTSYSFEEMRFFFLPTELFYDEVIQEMIQVQPDDIELTFLMCTLCFQLTGRHFGGRILEEMERLQDVLSNDLHNYYMENKRKRYIMRLKSLLKVRETFLRQKRARQEKYKIGALFDMFNRSFSNPEFFTCSP